MKYTNMSREEAERLERSLEMQREDILKRNELAATQSQIKGYKKKNRSYL